MAITVQLPGRRALALAFSRGRGFLVLESGRAMSETVRLFACEPGLELLSKHEHVRRPALGLSSEELRSR